ncbi:hypothetical protein [Paenibacillus hunanensis]|nr:hypothetical protein [Paenibacillus hunanensis]
MNVKPQNADPFALDARGSAFCGALIVLRDCRQHVFIMIATGNP